MSASADFTFPIVLFRLFLAAAAAGVIGYGRTKRRRTAGLRTFMLTAIGAALTILLAIYEAKMLEGPWADVVALVGKKFDAGRYAAQVLSGVGFLAAGSIIATDHQQVEGLTTATGLFASVCMGLAAGAGFYVAFFLSLLLILLSLNLMAPLETMYKRRLRNITLFIEFDALENINDIVGLIEKKQGKVLGIDIENMEKTKDSSPSAIFSLRLSKENSSHSEMLATIAEMPCVYGIEELIA